MFRIILIVGASLATASCAELFKQPESGLPPSLRPQVPVDPMVASAAPPDVTVTPPAAPVVIAPAPVITATAPTNTTPSPAPTPINLDPQPMYAPAMPAAAPSDYYDPASNPDYNLSCTDFFELLKKHQPTSVEETLAAVQRFRPKFLTRTVYSYQTKMPFNDATPISPRAVVYGGDAKTILNFGGPYRKPGFERMETICFDEQQSKFDFYDIVFPKDATTPEAIADLTDVEKQMKNVVIANGRGQRECARCHETPLRPNWDTYALWPGYYGAVDDALKDHSRPDSHASYATIELDYWRRFQLAAPKRKRYAVTSQELARANSDFTMRLSYLNGRRIVGDLKRAGAAFVPHKYEFAKALFCAPRAERRTFRQLSGTGSIDATFAVLPESADLYARDIFLSAYDDQMQKEHRLSEIITGIPTPLPKERFEQLRAYYRGLFKDKEINLDMKLSTVNIDEVLLMREIKRVTDKIDLDIENWSMVRDGGFLHENGLGGEGYPSFRLILERPYVTEFLKDDKDIVDAINAREEIEKKYFPEVQSERSPAALAAELEQANAKLCGMIAKRIK